MLARLAMSARRPALARSLCTATESYSQRMEKTGRPLSPHLEIYKLPAIAWSSLGVRASGVVVSFAVAGVATAQLAGGTEVLTDLTQEVAASKLGFVAKFAVGFSCLYHWAGNLRHAVRARAAAPSRDACPTSPHTHTIPMRALQYWDFTAKGFNNKVMLHGAYGLLGALSRLRAPSHTRLDVTLTAIVIPRVACRRDDGRQPRPRDVLAASEVEG